MSRITCGRLLANLLHITEICEKYGLTSMNYYEMIEPWEPEIPGIKDGLELDTLYLFTVSC